MLNAEEASGRLESLKNPDWRSDAEGRLPDDLALPFIEQPKDRGSYQQYQRHRDRIADAARRLDALDDRRRLDVMTALHPGLGVALARWWTDDQGRPYLRNQARRAFRMPNTPEMTVEARGHDLAEFIRAVGPFEADPRWLAAWGGHLMGKRAGWLPRTIGGVLASGIDLGGDPAEETLSILISVGNGEHPVGVMSRHVITALLYSSRPEGWDFTERLLLAAQRQEGLRQVILESADEGHPDAFDKILRCVLDNNLLRFAAAVRAAGVWLGFGASIAELPSAVERVSRLALLRVDQAERRDALSSGIPWDVYLALCAQGMRDVLVTIPEMSSLADHASRGVRAAVARYAAETGTIQGQHLLIRMLDDPDTGVASLARALISGQGWQQPGAFDALCRLIPRLPQRASKVSTLGVQDAPVLVSRQLAAGHLVDALGERPPGDLAPWLPAMDATGRYRVASRIGKESALTPDLREVMVRLLSDRSSQVSNEAVRTLSRLRLDPAEAPAVETLLTRTSATMRRGALTLLSTLPAAEVRVSAGRLAASADQGQRAAADELLRQLGDAGEEIADLRVTMTVDRTPPLVPRRGGGPFSDAVATKTLEALDDLVYEHRNTVVTVTNWQGSREVLLGDAGNQYLPSFITRLAPRDPGMLLAEVFREWWLTRPGELHHDDALDALRAYVTAAGTQPRGLGGFADLWIGLLDDNVPVLRYPSIVRHIASRLAADDPSSAVIDECLDALETSLASVPHSRLLAPVPRNSPSSDWRGQLRTHPWRVLLNYLLSTSQDSFTAAQIGRWYRLMRWVEKPHPEAESTSVAPSLLLAAHDAGLATDADVAAELLRLRSYLLREFTGRRPGKLARTHPRAVTIAQDIRDRITETELRRGDLPTPTSDVVPTIRSVTGAALIVRLLEVLGASKLTRGRAWSSGSKDAVLSHLVRVSYPAPGDTPEALTGVEPHRLIELALYAPQWASLVEQSVGWPGLTDGVLWLHAHTKDKQWSVEKEVRESWEAMIAERTALSSADLLDGAVDIDWFHAGYTALGQQRWKRLHAAAKFASGGNGHRRAQVFADAMLGTTDEETLTERITSKRDQDAVRALGLLPLPEVNTARQDTRSHRYSVLREFERGIRKFGAQRQASEKTALRIGIENLARTAGYTDPAHFVWTLEASEAGALADGPVTVTKDDVTMVLSVSPDGVPDLSVRRGNRVLRSVPAAIRKAPWVAELRDQAAALRQQAVRVRADLESAMTGQAEFRPADLDGLRRHPVLAPLLARLIWVGPDSVTCTFTDRPAQPLRIAHPADLVAEGSWVSWQERLFAGQWRQPFKQGFREFYALTAEERKQSPVSHRYDGHQLQPRQAVALLQTRGWLASAEEGRVSRTFHAYDLVAHVLFDGGFLTPAEADLPIIDGVSFTRRGESLLQPLDSIPPVVFSEAMRDLDLVVSVAHVGGVDPETTASTTQMRAALIRETGRLMKLTNITFAGDHLLIDGTLGEYSVHLGSGTVHWRPGGSVCIIPVGSQHRGRLFLPFADDDPKTAEIVSKALLLARDREIKDPTILEQLRS
jgi:hypothetical protein